MYQAHGWWFPDQDTHFAEMLNKNVAKGQQPVYQEPVRRRSLDFVTRKCRALDIGANVGLWCLDLCKNFDSVIAIEPVAEFRQCLQMNVKAHNLEIMPIALGAEDTTINMIITKENTGHSHVDVSSLGQGCIPMRQLDSLNLPTVDYIKIDCEGYEKLILLGAKQTLMRDRPIIVIEDKNHKDVGHDQTNSALGYLQELGARILQRVNNDVIVGWS